MQNGKEFVVAQPAMVEPAPSPCTQCGARTWLMRITPTAHGYELRTFECRNGHINRYAVVHGSSLPWVLIRE